MKRSLPSLAYQLLLLVLGAFCLAMAGKTLQPIQQQRGSHMLTENAPLNNAPPQLVLATTALGGFRGLIIDYLWLRAMELRNKGAHYEIVQLYDWIGKLEPRIPEVWQFTAHELVYNISVTMPSGQERWRWILRGIEHIRDFGLVYNENSPKLYYQLAFIFWDKMSIHAIDVYRFYYPLQWAQLMEEVLTDKQDLQQLCEYSRLPASFLETPDIQALLKAGQEAHLDIAKDFFNLRHWPEAEQERMRQLLAVPAHQEAFNKLSIYLRARRLCDEFKLDPHKMLELEKRYRYLDFRLPSSQALYWAEEGYRVLKLWPELKDTAHDYNMDRIRFGALQQNFEYGVIVSRGELGLVCMPNFAILDSLHQMFEEIQAKWGETQGLLSHETFLRHAVWNCYMYNRRQEAQRYYRLLANKFNKPDYQQDLDAYALGQIGAQIKYIGKRVDVENFMVGTLLLAMHALRNDPEQAQGLLDFARLSHREYMKRHEGSEVSNEMEQPRPLSHFIKIASQAFVEQLRKELGEQRGKELYDRMCQQVKWLNEGNE